MTRQSIYLKPQLPHLPRNYVNAGIGKEAVKQPLNHNLAAPVLSNAIKKPVTSFWFGTGEPKEDVCVVSFSVRVNEAEQYHFRCLIHWYREGNYTNVLLRL